jgi:hypothetical protein
VSSENEFSYESPTVPANALFVECTDPVRVFPSIRAAELQLESLDLDSAECSVAYGPSGEIYRIRMESAGVRIERAEEPDRPDELKYLLLHYFECCEDPWDATDELKCLVDEAWSIERNYWLRSKADEHTYAHRLPAWALVPFVILIVTALYLAFRR